MIGIASRARPSVFEAVKAYVLGLHDPEVLEADRSAVRVGDGPGLDAPEFAVA